MRPCLRCWPSLGSANFIETLGGKGTDLAVDEWEGEALRITVSASIGSSAGVQLAPATISFHFRQIKCTVHAARKLGEVDLDADFVARQLEHLILLLVLFEEIESRAHHVAILVELRHVKLVPSGGDTILRIVADALDDAVLGAGLRIGADGDVGCIAPVSAVVAGVVQLMDRVGERVQDKGAVLLYATATVGAFPGLQPWVHFFGLAGSLCRHKTKKEKDDDGKSTSHDCEAAIAGMEMAREMRREGG